MRFDELNPENWMSFAILNYVNPSSVTYEEFEEDIGRFKYIKRLLCRYEIHGELKINLILNHIIMLYNSFNDAATPLLLFKIDRKYWPMLKAFMLFLNRLPNSLNHDVDQECLKLLNLI